MASTLEWLVRIFELCNKDRDLEFEVKFCDQFQGLVPELPQDFRVGINVTCFHKLKEYFEGKTKIW